ncbi:MAG TPA: FAD-binding oxidoreductase [Anaerolineae bacterium]|nr:FAD-binding oxidoreductase [Anaerolineae bacterium]
MAVRSAEIIIIGGGAIGCAIAEALARRDAGRVLVIERNTLASGSTSQAAALLTVVRPQPLLIPLVQETLRVIHALSEAAGEELGLHAVGSLHVATTPTTQRALIDLVRLAQHFSLRAEWIDRAEASRRAPWLTAPDEARCAFMSDEAFIDPYLLTQALAQAARQRGAEFIENCAVTDIAREANAVTGVTTDHGFISAPLVIDAAGAWAALLATPLEVFLPMAPVRSHYWITAPAELFTPIQPIAILPDARAYTRPENGALLFGVRESAALSFDPRQLPAQMNGYVKRYDRNGWQSLLEGLPSLAQFVPALPDLPIAHYIAGLSTYTPDGLPLLGGLAGLKGFLAATGCSGAGMALCGGIGRIIAELATGQTPLCAIEPFRLERFGVVDPYSADFRARCAAARSHKTSG